MVLNKNIIRAANKAIYTLAEDIMAEPHYDEQGHLLRLSWEDCIDYAKEDFDRDVKGWMACQGIDPLSDERAQEISEYAAEHINWQSLLKFA